LATATARSIIFTDFINLSFVAPANDGPIRRGSSVEASRTLTFSETINAAGSLRSQQRRCDVAAVVSPACRIALLSAIHGGAALILVGLSIA
jgi:hypothetical protein